MVTESKIKGYNMVKVIDGFPNYEISSEGWIRNIKTNKKFYGSIATIGYRETTLAKKGKKYKRYLHRLIAEHFIPNSEPEIKTQVNHIDGNKLNNNLDNLEWVTPSENIKHAWDTNLRPYNRKLSKEEYKKLLLNDFFKMGKSITEIAKEKGIGLTQLSLHFKEFVIELSMQKDYDEELLRQKRARAKARRKK